MSLKVISFADTPLVATNWLWKPFFAYGKLTILHGNMGEGKTTLAVEIMSKLSNGYDPTDKKLDTLKKCLYVSAEDSYEEGLNRRFRFSGANMTNVFHFDDSYNDNRIQSLPTANEIANAVKQYTIDVVVIDPILAFMPGVNMNVDNEVRQALEPYRRMAIDSNCCVIMISHPTKNEKQSAFYRLSGSGAFGNMVRSASVIGRDKEDESMLLLKCYKCNDCDIRNMPAHIWCFKSNGSLRYKGTKNAEIDDILSKQRYCGKSSNIEILIKSKANTTKEVLEKTAELLQIATESVGAKKATFYNARKKVLTEYKRKGL